MQAVSLFYIQEILEMSSYLSLPIFRLRTAESRCRLLRFSIYSTKYLKNFRVKVKQYNNLFIIHCFMRSIFFKIISVIDINNKQ